MESTQAYISVKDVDYILSLALDAGFRYDPFEIVIFTSPYHTYLYSKMMKIEGLEHHIISDACASYLYAKDVMNDRLYEAEEVIITDPDVAYLYMRDVIGEVWETFRTKVIDDKLHRHAFLICQRFGHDDDLADLISEDPILIKKYVELFPDQKDEFSFIIELNESH